MNLQQVYASVVIRSNRIDAARLMRRFPAVYQN